MAKTVEWVRKLSFYHRRLRKVPNTLQRQKTFVYGFKCMRLFVCVRIHDRWNEMRISAVSLKGNCA